MAPKNQFIQRTLYQLQRQYGAKVDFYHIVSKVSDDITGQTVVTKTKFLVKRAIKLPSSQTRKVLMGGTYDEDEVIFIFDRIGLPKDFTICEADYLVYKGKRFNVKSFWTWDNDAAYEITARAMEGADLEQVFIFNIIETFNLKQGVVNA